MKKQKSKKPSHRIRVSPDLWRRLVADGERVGMSANSVALRYLSEKAGSIEVRM